jgi:autoinducer 2-degrading protein
MIVRIIDVHVNKQSIEEFKRITVQNRAGSIQEQGVLRFDVLQSDSDPQHFILYEVYQDEQATLDHKETDHYQRWREAVEPMMARKRESTSCTPVAPSDPGEW